MRYVAAMGRLSCAPPKPGRGDGTILDCWPFHLGDSPPFVSLHLEADFDAYAVMILGSFCGISGPRLLCPIQDRLAQRLDLRLGGGTFERDPRPDA